MDTPKVSVIIPTRDRSSLLRRCLGALKKQTYPNIEIIVVDGNSELDDVEISREYTDRVFVFEKPGDHRCAQRNMGVEKSEGEYVLIIDSDMELSPGVVESCVGKMESDTALRGIIIPEESFGEGFWAECKKLEKSFYVGVDAVEAARFFHRKDFEAVGGYDEDMTSGEDWNLSDRIEMLGPIGRVDDLIYHNEGRISFWQTLRKKYYYAGKASEYVSKSSDVPTSKKRKVGILGRYRIFFSDPGKLFRNPLLGVGMLFMKTCEFFVGGLGYCQCRITRRKDK